MNIISIYRIDKMCIEAIYYEQNSLIKIFNKDFEYAIYYFPLFVVIWFGKTPIYEFIDSNFSEIYIINNY